MRTQIAISVSVLITGMAAAWTFAPLWSTASGDSDRAEIFALNRHINDAIAKKDIDAVMACYVEDDDLIFFEETIPFQFKGRTAVRKYVQDLIASPSHIHNQMEAGSVLVSGALAAALYTLRVSWTDKHGSHTERGRYTQVLKKIDGRWLIWHEHFSFPYDPATGRAVFDARP